VCWARPDLDRPRMVEAPRPDEEWPLVARDAEEVRLYPVPPRGCVSCHVHLAVAQVAGVVDRNLN
jgi:hypothetical protein